ncbi:MAG TPA: anti-sigma F factor [Peptococcaceae bacterium]|nr:MAG: Putative anti-sigma regulatory factor (Serine/threonine protein kinase) [Clostridia bacterium 41_269]HBT20475.1 anti-sigma F factor [Peptococcaceae bacterium]
MTVKDRGEIINYVQLEFLSVPENVSLSRVVVASFAAQLDLTLNDLEEIKVAVSEAVSNSIIHGYNNKPVGKVYVTVMRYEKELVIIVKDEGVGIKDVKKAMEAAYSTDPERMGLGFVFMKSFMDEVNVVSEPGKGTTVELVKKLELPKKTTGKQAPKE